MGADMNCKVLSSEGKGGIRGNLMLRYDVMMKDGNGWKVDEDGEGFEDVEDPADMAGKAINFQFGIDEITDLPEDCCTNLFCTYSMKHVPNDKYSTDELKGQSTNQNFKFKKLHSIDCMTDYHLEYFNKGQIGVKVYGYPFYKGKYS